MALKFYSYLSVLDIFYFSVSLSCTQTFLSCKKKPLVTMETEEQHKQENSLRFQQPEEKAKTGVVTVRHPT
ncbi:hypothetical protein GN956_G7851 [Arapaima gigas]